MTKSEQKTLAHANPQHKKASESEMKPFRSRRIGGDEWTVHSSLTYGAKAIGLSPGTVSTVLNDEKKFTAGGYEIEWCVDVDLPGEEWRDVEE